VAAAESGIWPDHQRTKTRSGKTAEKDIDEDVTGPGLEKGPVTAVPIPRKVALLGFGGEEHNKVQLNRPSSASMTSK
jgi:hypothetical protein